MRFIKSFLAAASTAAVLAACGGSSDPVVAPAAAGGTAGSVTGSISAIVGDYTVDVVKADCSAADSTPTITIAPQANGSCKITSTVVGTVVEFRRDILPVGRYTLRVGADGSLDMLQSNVSKAKLACPTGGICNVTATPAFTTYTLAGGTGTGTAVTVGISQVLFTISGTVKSVLSAVVYGIGGNATFAGTNPVLSGESGVLVFASP